jgi:hypothetical protein
MIGQLLPQLLHRVEIELRAEAGKLLRQKFKPQLYGALDGRPCMPQRIVEIEGDQLYVSHGSGFIHGFLARTRVRLIVDLGQMLEIQMRVDLRRGQIGVTQQFLHRAQIAG